MDVPPFCLSLRQLLDIWVGGFDIFLALKNNAAVNVFVAMQGMLKLDRVAECPGELVKTRIARPYPQTL